MSAIPSSPSMGELQLSPEGRAAALWSFVNAKAPRFTLQSAIELINELGIRPEEDHRALAKRLRKALESHGIAMKHTNALQAVANIFGHTSWHTDKDANTPRLRFTSFDKDRPHEIELPSWDALATELRTWSDKLHTRGQLPLGVLSLSFNGRSLIFTTPVLTEGNGNRPAHNEMWPLGAVTSLVETDDWLLDAPAAIEKLRRHLEETRKAVIDGFAILQLCLDDTYSQNVGLRVTAADAVNSELILMREDDEDDPRSGFEIARGDELTCWHQLELSLWNDRTNSPPAAIEITIPAEGSGAWIVNGIRYVWEVETIKPDEYVPGKITRRIGLSDCERLLRRYKLAKRIHNGGFKHHDMTKRLEYLSGPPTTYRVDQHRLLHMLNEKGLTWESYIDNFQQPTIQIQPLLPADFVLELLQNLQVQNPNQIFALPPLSEMAHVEGNDLLLSLMPRVDMVRYIAPRDLAEAPRQAAREAMENFGNAIQMQKMMGFGGLQMERELPYLVYTSDVDELRGAIDCLGLTMHVAVMPHLHSIPDGLLTSTDVKTLPWALGHAIFFRLTMGPD